MVKHSTSVKCPMLSCESMCGKMCKPHWNHSRVKGYGVMNNDWLIECEEHNYASYPVWPVLLLLYDSAYLGSLISFCLSHSLSSTESLRPIIMLSRCVSRLVILHFVCCALKVISIQTTCCVVYLKIHLLEQTVHVLPWAEVKHDLVMMHFSIAYWSETKRMSIGGT
jgi:hypothetical protein